MISDAIDIDEPGRLGLIKSEKCRVYEWSDNGEKVYFAAARKGNALMIHLAAEKRNWLRLRDALNEFCQKMFFVYDWCKMIIAQVGKRSVINLALKCGFHIAAQKEVELDGKLQNISLVVRVR